MTHEPSAATVRTSVILEASVVTPNTHDAARFLDDVRQHFANIFSCYVHEFYPDAQVSCRVEAGEVDRG